MELPDIVMPVRYFGVNGWLSFYESRVDQMKIARAR